MSKITQALEKAARERLKLGQEQPNVAGEPVVVPLVSAGIGEIASAGRIHIDPHIVSAADPKSTIAEQYRILKANLRSLHLRHGSKAIVVTSSVRGEGKSVTAINLALTLARHENLKVVLVDGDLRRGSVHTWLGLPESAHGFSSALTQGGVLNGSLVRLQSPSLTVLSAGPSVEHPDELLESQATRRLLASLKAQFDVDLIDSTSVLSVADPGILALQTDGVLVMVQAGKTQRKTLSDALTRLSRIKATLLGSVLTHADEDLAGYARYYREYQKEADASNGAPVPPALH